ncbi:MAG: peroxiredoxin [Thermoplasmata archaeon]
MIGVGEAAPAFTGTAQDGSRFDSASLQGKPYVLYFYPKANTAGCSIEAKGFAQHYPALQRAGIAVVGVSVDSVADQKSFAEKCGVPFPLIADKDKSVATRYGVIGLLGVAKRVTFFVGADGRVTEVVQGILPGPHIRRTAELVQTPPSPGAAPG